MITLNLSACQRSGASDFYYEFLGWIPTQLPPETRILEAGTHHGESAACLGRKGHRVDTFDCQKFSLVAHIPPNVKCHIMPIENAEDSTLLNAAVHYLDIDPHDGIAELKYHNRLISLGFQGIVFCDDINFPDMHKFWNSITQPKISLPHVHGNTGFGVVNYGNLFELKV